MIFVNFIFGLLNYIVFAYDIEHDRDFMTWVWLLTSVIFFVLSYENYKEWKLRKNS